MFICDTSRRHNLANGLCAGTTHLLMRRTHRGHIQSEVQVYALVNRRQSSRPVSVQALHDWLVGEHGYQGSYKSVLRYVRAEFPQPKLRPFRRNKPTRNTTAATGPPPWGREYLVLNSQTPS